MGWQSVQTDCTKCTHNIAVSERETICLQWYDVLPCCGACQGCSTLYMIWQKWLYMKCRWDYGLAISSNRQHQMHSQHRSVWTWNNLFAVIWCLTMLWSLPRLFYTIYDIDKNDYIWNVGGTMGWQSVQTDCTKCTQNTAVSECETMCLHWCLTMLWSPLRRCSRCGVRMVLPSAHAASSTEHRPYNTTQLLRLKHNNKKYIYTYCINYNNNLK